jgi:hypothetical protein
LREDCSREVFGHPPCVKQRRALGALFALLSIGFAGIAFAAAYGAGREMAGWAIVLAAAALAVWLASMAFRALRSGADSAAPFRGRAGIARAAVLHSDL